MQKRFRAKDKTKMIFYKKEDLDNDSQYTTDEIEEEARRSASCILFFSAIVRTQYATTSIANFSISLHKPYNCINHKTTKLQLTIQ